MKRKNTPTEELDLVISGMISPEMESHVKSALGGMPGIVAVRLLDRGAWIRYNPLGVSKEQICDVLGKAGFSASVFQDSASGKTGRFSS